VQLGMSPLGQKEPSHIDVNEKERPPCGGLSKVVSRLRSRGSGCPRLRCLGFLNGLCGVADYVQHSKRLGEHRNVTGAQLDGCGAHALCNGAVQFGLDGAIFSGHDVPARFRPPSDAVGLLVEQVGHRHGLGRPHNFLLRFGRCRQALARCVHQRLRCEKIPP
jgi:hypothetical protein